MPKKELKKTGIHKTGISATKPKDDPVRVPPSVLRAIKTHARAWVAAQESEAALAKAAMAQSQQDWIQQEESMAKSCDIEPELEQLRKRRGKSH